MTGKTPDLTELRVQPRWEQGLSFSGTDVTNILFMQTRSLVNGSLYLLILFFSNKKVFDNYLPGRIL